MADAEPFVATGGAITDTIVTVRSAVPEGYRKVGISVAVVMGATITTVLGVVITLVVFQVDEFFFQCPK